MTRINLRVHPNSSRNRVMGFRGDVLHVRVTAPPVAGEANRAVIALLAESLAVPKSLIRIVRGHTSRDKSLDVETVTLERVRERFPGIEE